ncbi:hypothetical protein PR202_ga10869 [Eleusine coracana subsp. coracana]|uniref:Glycosyltransferase 61 catalytic domain-containing protein n=1 Tax=Eleusine coracana subsp. coracana TaxID=191504 RepID=A0AAV5C7X1_ELECO|nr:hypothetical protein QOZ80_1AG0019510 [Eleusine coracana subsp. coracana]GJM94239.1 hypothetical protein PR202_ga10869 [Eleusine coracana subsp. coracana]
MVHHHRASLLAHQQQQRKQVGDDVEEGGVGRMKEFRGRLADYACQHRKHGHNALLRLLAGFALVSCLLLLLPGSPVSRAIDELLELGNEGGGASSLPSSPPCVKGICCDRTSPRTDVCVMRGDVRTHAASNSLFLHQLVVNKSEASPPTEMEMEERIRPYTRKWESSIMSTIDELRLRTAQQGQSSVMSCDVRHDVPAVVFSTGGYTGNVYHEFNDGIIPLYITARRYDRKVVFVMLEYHAWWITKYGHILQQLSDYPPIDFANDRRTHCFPEAVVGLRIHDELAIDAERMQRNSSIKDFRRMLDDAYRGRIQTIIQEEERLLHHEEHNKEEDHDTEEHNTEKPNSKQRPLLVIVSRNGSRAIDNEAQLVRAADAQGFRVSVLQPRQDMELAKIYRSLNASDVMVGVHGAAMTHFLFMRPGSVFIQIVPLGTDWAAETYYGHPARRLGLRYMPYKIKPSESSLSARYARDHPVLTHPDALNAKGWQVTKKVYLDGQNVRLDMPRFRRHLRQAYAHYAAQNS